MTTAATAPLCYPWWHFVFTPLIGNPVYIRSGCATVNGNVNCAPETMRAAAEAQLRAKGYTDALSLDAYSLARNIQTEVGANRVEEMVALAESTMNQAKRRGLSVTDLLINATRVAANHGFYGPIHGEDGVSSAPYGRWSATSADPTVLALQIAQLVLAGKTENFTGGADDQMGMEYLANPTTTVNALAAQGDYWVGPLVGVNPWVLFLTKHGSTNPAADLARAQAFAATGVRGANNHWSDPTASVWVSQQLPTCPATPAALQASTNKKLAIAAGVLGVAAVGGLTWWVMQRANAKAVLGKAGRKKTKRLGNHRSNGRLIHESDDQWDVFADVLLDAGGSTDPKRIERDLRRAAKIYRDLHKEHGFVTLSTAAETAWHALPLDEHWRLHELISEDA